MNGEVLSTLDAYFDEVPRDVTVAHAVGPFTVFVAHDGGFPYYARPRRGLSKPVSADDVRAVVAWQAGRGQPGAIEWIEQLNPSVRTACIESGLDVQLHPLLHLREQVEAPSVPGVSVRPLASGDEALIAVRAALETGFVHGGTAVGPAGAAERDAAIQDLDPAVLRRLTAMLGDGRLAMFGAFDAQHGAVGGGSHARRGRVTELTGIAILPAFRRRGIGAALTAALVAGALAHGADTVCCSAQDETGARVYEAVGFARIGSTGAAAAPDPWHQ